MSIRSYLQGLGARHLFTLDNEGASTADDLGSSVSPTNIVAGAYTFEPEPVCYGVTHCVRSTTSTSEAVDGAVIANRRDINSGTVTGDSSSYDWATNTHQVYFWARQKELYNVTCLFEQGGGTNNQAVMGGARCTWQAADAGQPFLIVPSRTLSIKDRAILHWGGWEYRTAWGGSDNRIWYTENGIVQGYDNQGGTASFPGHSGDIVIGNSAESLKTFNENTLVSETVAQDSNFWGFRNNAPVVNLSVGDEYPPAREFFERQVLPEVLIDADTVANQQAALDALSGNVYKDVNCAIEVRQATDATDYALTLNNVQFVQNAALKDIAVKFVGVGNLRLINANGSNAEIAVAPVEQDLDGTTVLTGGGTITVQNTRTLTFDDVQNGLEIRLRRGIEAVDGVQDVVSGSWAYSYVYSGFDVPVTAVVSGEGLVESVSLNVVLIDQDQVIPVGSIVSTDTGYE